MPSLVNPMDALKQFEPALKAGHIAVQQGDVDPDVWVHLDHPNGQVRFTYARIKNGIVNAIALLTPAGVHEGLPVFQLGYAVPQHLRKRGYAKDIVNAAIAEFRNGMGRNGVPAFYIEAVVGVDNIGSQKVAEAILGAQFDTGNDDESGEAVIQYMLKVER